ncbi:LruC domain-containing protein, partial [Bacteroides uniformis]|uniref:LruC domain-containing protein n=1 Tax=Bacteroides uniformis TaxID=820 RepID=UPI00202FECF6
YNQYRYKIYFERRQSKKKTLTLPPQNCNSMTDFAVTVCAVFYTEKADMALFHTEEDLSSVPTSYYVANGNYPFAIHLSGATNFNTPETHPIDKSFEHFMDWVNSNGTDYKDWYK